MTSTLQDAMQIYEFETPNTPLVKGGIENTMQRGYPIELEHIIGGTFFAAAPL